MIASRLPKDCNLILRLGINLFVDKYIYSNIYSYILIDSQEPGRFSVTCGSELGDITTHGHHSSPLYTIKANKKYLSTSTATHGSYWNLSLDVVTFKTSTSFGFSKAPPKEIATGFLTTGSLNYFCFLSNTNNIEHNNMIDTCALDIFI